MFIPYIGGLKDIIISECESLEEWAKVIICN